MDELNKDPGNLTPEEQLDLLLEKFLTEFDEEIPTAEPTQETAEDGFSDFALIPEETDADPLSFFQDILEMPEPLDDPAEEIAPEGMPELFAEEEITVSLDEEEVPEERNAEDEVSEEANAEDEEVFEETDAEDEEMIPIVDLDTEDEIVEEAPEAVAEETSDEEEYAQQAEADTEETDQAEIDEALLADVIAEFSEDPDEEKIEEAEESAEIDEIEEVEEIEEAEAPAEETESPSDPEPEEAQQEQTQPEEEAEPEPEESPAEPVAALPPQEEPAAAEPQPDAPEEEDEEPYEEPAPPKKRRPKNTKAYGLFGIPHMLTTAIWLGIVIFIGVGLGQFIWNCASDLLALGRADSEVIITITDDDDLDSVAEKLKTTGLIEYPSLFKLYGQISEAMDSIRSGTFKLNTKYDYHALVEAMSSNQLRETTSVTIPEGFNCAQTFQYLESKGVTSAAKLREAAANADLGEYWFLEGVERGTENCLEGFLFPDTYTFYLDHDPVGVLQKFLDNFNKRFNDVMKIKLDTLNLNLSERMRANGLSEEYIASHQMTVRDIVIIASMIEKETASNPESYNISSVIYNRLVNPEEYPYLNIDAALVYVLGHGNLTAEDLAYDSPYNTHIYPGLIPGAISNPGSYSLDAALDPAESNYHFYALDPETGSHHFSNTLKEHNDFLESIRPEESEEEEETPET